MTRRSVLRPNQAAVSSSLHLAQPAMERDNSQSRSNYRTLQSHVRVVLTLALIGAGFLFAINQRDVLSTSVSHLRSLTTTAVVLVLACWITMVVSRGLVYRLTHHQFRFRHGVALDQVNLAASNGLPGGAVIGIAARMKMCRQLGHRSEQGALTVFASGQAFAAGRWVCLLIVLTISMASRGIHSLDLIEFSVGLLALLLSAATWTALTVESRLSHKLLEGCETVLTRTSRTKGAFRRARFRASIARLRSSASGLVRECAMKLVVVGALSTVFGAFILVLVINDLSATHISELDVLRAYLIARVATSFAPTPGAVGVLDSALTAGLIATGVDPAIAVAAVVIYRAFTFVLPIVLGSVIYLGWYRRLGISDPATHNDGSTSPDSDGQDVTSVPAVA